MSNFDKTLSAILLFGGGLFTVCAQITDKAQPLENPARLYPLTIFGFLVFITGTITVMNEKIPQWLDRLLAVPARWLNLQKWQVAALFLSIFFSILTHYAAGDLEKMNSAPVAWVAWISAIGLVVIGSWKAGELDFSSKKKTFLIALIFTLVALPIRSLWLNDVPVVLNGDEGSAGIYAMAFLDGTANNAFNVGWYSFPGLYFLSPALSIALFGNTTAALRLPSAIIGAITVGGTYLAGKTLFDQRTGILAAIVLAGFHFHIHFSRIGLNNIWDGLFFVMTVMTAWHAWEKENRNASILTGVGLGLSQYYYPSTRVLAGVIFGGMFLAGLFDIGRLKRMLGNIFLLSIAAIVIIIPITWYYISYPEQFLAPMQRVSIIGPWLDNEMLITGLPASQILAKQLWLGLQSFTSLNLQHWYRPETSFLRPLSSGLFLLGLGYLIVRPKSFRSLSFILWLLMYVLLGGLSESTPAAQRYVGAAPVCILLVAHGLAETGNFIEKLWPKTARWVTGSLIAAGLFLAVDDMNFYFNQYTPKTVIEFEQGDTGVAQRFADYLIDKPKGTQVFFYHGTNMGYYSIPSIAYLAPQVEGYDITQPWGTEGNPVPTSKHPIFIFVPSTIQQLPYVQKAYPDGKLQEFKARNGATMFWIYE